ncbi:MAG: cob(I)yrinic acid a,c-diamide adenosyltransferase [Chloroflexota bacterium]
MAPFFTRRGDDGTTGLLGEGRVAKDHPRIEAAGAVEEASAALGLARAVAGTGETRDVLLDVQYDLYPLMSELAAEPDVAARLQRLQPDRVEWLEQRIEALGGRIEMPREFIVPGDCLAGAALDLARTIVRRSERLVARLVREGLVRNRALLPYLNRLSSLCFVLELWEVRQAGLERPTLAKREAE